MSRNNKITIIISIAILLIAAGAYVFRGDIERKLNPAPVPTPAAKDEKISPGGVNGEGANASKQEDNAPTPAPAPSEEEPEGAALPAKAMVADVPFASQAPFGDWADPRQQHGCEEASLLMARYWMLGKKLTKETALTEIFAMSEYEAKNYGGAWDLSLEDTLKFWREYYGYKKSFTKYDITAEDIKREIAQGNPVITPVDGTKLDNPYYTAPGPERHELVVIGYDDEKGEFITNDPGTRFGQDYRYAYEIFMASIRDYETGFDAPIDKTVKGMLVIEKE